MPISILMPALSPTMEKGNLAKWHVKEGDTVKSGDVIAEIETDKATMEVEAVDEGTVGKILVAEGTSDVPVNEVIAMLLGEGEDASAAQNAAPQAAKAPVQQGGETGAAPMQASAAQGAEAARQPAAVAQPSGEDARHTKAEQLAGDRGYGVTPGNSPVTTQGTQSAPGGRTNGSGQTARSNGAAPGAHAESGRIFASPLARRLAKEAGIDLSAVQGSGPHGRIVKSDIDAAKQGGAQRSTQPQQAKAPEAPRPAMAPSMSDNQIRSQYEPGSFEEKPHDGMRRTIARRLVESKQTVPHFYLTMDVSLDALLALRTQINDAAPKEGPAAYKVSVNDFVIKAMALALQKVPLANATWTESARLLHKHSDVGVAVSVPDGLFTPVIRKAETKTLSAISAEMKDLAGRARSKKLKPEEYQGGTTAVSNLGMFGVKDFAAVINPPHGTILAVGAGEQRVVVKNGAPAVGTVMSCTLSVDHRAVDGALGAELLQAFKGYVEAPVSMLV